MESPEVLATNMPFHRTDGVHDKNADSLHSNGFELKQAGIVADHSDIQVEFLDDLDTIMEDIDNRVRITRMVSDSVIKGMVSAVEKEADEKIKAKDLELTTLKRSLHFHNVNGDQNGSWWHEPENVEVNGYTGSEDVHKLKESLVVLRHSATDQFKKLRKQIEGVKGCKIKRNVSCHEMVGLGGILKEEKYENGVGLEKTVDNLEKIMNNTYRLADDVLIYSKKSLNECQQEHELERELEGQNIVLAEKFSNISCLRNELKALTKLLPSSESGNLVSHGSFDADNIHGNPLRSQLSSRWEENGKSVEGFDVSDSFGAAQLSHMNKEELVKFFNNMIGKMKREHESKVQEITEEHISLKGKYLRLSERRSLVLPNKEFEILKKKIPEVVSKLDGILSESNEFPGKVDSVASFDGLNKTLNTLLKENHQLKDSVAVKNDEVNHLSSQLSVEHTSSAASFQNLVKTHESLMEDACIEASIVEDVYKCVVQEQNFQIQYSKEESELEIIAMQDVYDVLLGETSKNDGVCVSEDMFMESFFMQELFAIVYKESLTEGLKIFETLQTDFIATNKRAHEKEVELILEGEKRAKLVEEKERVERELTKEREQFETALKKKVNWQEKLMSKKNEELDEIKDKLLKAQDKIGSLNTNLEKAMEKIKALNDYKNMVVGLSEEKQGFMSMIEMREKEHKKQMEAVVVLVDELSTKIVDFEKRVTRDILNNNTRLQKSRSELSCLIKEVIVLKRTGLQYKQKLESKCSDLQMAEDEVDLLGDEVETLLGLLEKIYIALDHYSPVLQHYSGVIEILELVRRELSGESLKAR